MKRNLLAGMIYLEKNDPENALIILEKGLSQNIDILSQSKIARMLSQLR